VVQVTHEETIKQGGGKERMVIKLNPSSRNTINRDWDRDYHYVTPWGFSSEKAPRNQGDHVMLIFNGKNVSITFF